MAYGFQTSHGSLYVLEPGGRTRRYKVSRGDGQGQWDDWSHCVYIDAPKHISPMDIYDHTSQRLVLTSMDANGSYSSMRYGPNSEPLARDAICKHVGVLVQDRQSNKIVSHTAARPHPGYNLIPVEKSYSSDGTSSTHIGHPITKIFQNILELRDAFRAANVKVIKLPKAYLDELKKAEADESGHTLERTRSVSSTRTLIEKAEQEMAAQRAAARVQAMQQQKVHTHTHTRSR